MAAPRNPHPSLEGGCRLWFPDEYNITSNKKNILNKIRYLPLNKDSPIFTPKNASIKIILSNLRSRFLVFAFLLPSPSANWTLSLLLLPFSSFVLLFLISTEEKGKSRRFSSDQKKKGNREFCGVIVWNEILLLYTFFPAKPPRLRKKKILFARERQYHKISYLHEFAHNIFFISPNFSSLARIALLHFF